MPQPRNTRSVADLFSGFDATLRHYVWDRPRAYWHVLRGRFEHLAETNFKLGCEFAERGKWWDAVFRFRFALWREPGMVQAHYNLGCCYMQLHKRDKARDAFVKTLQLKPDHEEARFMLSGLDPRLPANALPRTMPKAMVTGFFTQIAPGYDRLAEANQYHGPRLVAESCKPYLAQSSGLQLLELGCGTGLVARPWRGLCRDVVGVDFTPAMATAAQTARAGDNPVFDRVLREDINALPPGSIAPGGSDVVLCVDTAQFLGDLAPALRAAADALRPGGLFVLTIEPYSAPHGYGVNPDTGRFGHTAEYVKQLGQASGLELKKDGRVALYAQLPAHLFVFAKRAA